MKLKQAIYYPFDIYSMLALSVIPIIGLMLFWSNLTPSQLEYLGYGYGQLTTYYLLAYALNIILSSEISFSIADDIHTGRLNDYLVMPCSYFVIKSTEVIVNNLLATMLLILLAAAGAARILPGFIAPGYDWFSVLALFVYMLLGALFNFCFAVTIGTLSVWFKRIEGLFYFQTAIVQILSGCIVPLSLLPDGMQWLKLNPFALLIYLPVDSYLFGAGSFWLNIAVYIVWIVASYITMKLVWRRAMIKYQAYGG